MGHFGAKLARYFRHLAPYYRPFIDWPAIQYWAYVRPSVHTFCLSGTTSQYLLVRFDSFLVQMISTMNSRYAISLVLIYPLTLEILPLLSNGNYKAKPILAFLCDGSSHFIKAIIFNNFSLLDHDCQVPVDKHGSVKVLPHPL